MSCFIHTLIMRGGRKVMKSDEYCVDKDKLLPILVGISSKKISLSLFSKVPDVPPITTQVQNVV